MNCVHVRIAIRRVQRHPVSRRAIRSGTLIRKHVVRGATLGLVPDALNDFAFHHAQVTVDEAIHLVLDQAAISSLTAVLAIALTMASQLGSD
jgi:ribosomal protein L31E